MLRKTKDEEIEGEQVEPKPDAIKIVDLDAVIQAEGLTPEQASNGQSFWLGEIGLLKFSDGSEFHIRKHREFITDPVLIENLKQAAQNPANRIFIE